MVVDLQPLILAPQDRIAEPSHYLNRVASGSQWLYAPGSGLSGCRAQQECHSLREPLAIYVAHRDHLDISTRLLPAQASFQVIPAARANPDLADIDAIVGAGDARGRHGRARQSNEAASAEFVRHDRPRLDCIRSTVCPSGSWSTAQAGRPGGMHSPRRSTHVQRWTEGRALR